MDKGHIQFIYCIWKYLPKENSKLPKHVSIQVQFFGKKSDGIENNKKKMEDFVIFLSSVVE